MSFTPIWSGNFHKISYVGSNCSFRILKSHAEFFPGKQLKSRICHLRPLATKLEQRNLWSHNSDACDISLTIPDGTAEWLKNDSKKKSDFLHCGIQKISDDKVFDRPATVLVFDTETTGLSRVRGRIIEIAIRDLIGGKNSTFQTLINPGRAVPNTDVHGISSDMVSRPGIPSFEELIPILLQFVSSRQRSGRPVLWIAHNGRRFDVPFLIMEFKRCSMGIPDDWYFLDTLYLARQLRKSDVGLCRQCSWLFSRWCFCDTRCYNGSVVLKKCKIHRLLSWLSHLALQNFLRWLLLVDRLVSLFFRNISEKLWLVQSLAPSH